MAGLPFSFSSFPSSVSHFLLFLFSLLLFVHSFHFSPFSFYLLLARPTVFPLSHSSLGLFVVRHYSIPVSCLPHKIFGSPFFLSMKRVFTLFLRRNRAHRMRGGTQGRVVGKEGSWVKWLYTTIKDGGLYPSGYSITQKVLALP